MQFCLLHEAFIMLFQKNNVRIVGRYLRSTLHVPSDTLRTWKWSPTPEWYMSLRAPKGPGSGPPPQKYFSFVNQSCKILTENDKTTSNLDICLKDAFRFFFENVTILEACVFFWVVNKYEIDIYNIKTLYSYVFPFINIPYWY